MLFLLSPLTGVISTYFYLVFQKQFDSKKITFFIVIASVLLGIINSGKTIESDLELYEIWYQDVPNYNLINYLFYLGKEPVFFLYNYILFYFSFGFFEVYLIIHTTLCYGIMGIAMLRMHNAFKVSKEILFISLLSLFLFPNLFSLSAHLLRQFLAATILLLFIIDVAFYNKRRLILFISAVFTHTSSFLYVLVYLFRRLRPTKTVLLILIACFGFFGLLLFQFSNLFVLQYSDDSVLSYGIERIQNRDSDLNFENLGILNYLLFLFIVGVFYILRLKLRSKNRALLLYISLLFLIFITFNYNDTEIALRFSFYLYFLFPLAVYFFTKFIEVNNFFKKNRIVIIFAFLSFASWFVFEFYDSIWHYNNMEKILFIGFWE
ncbi:EpsG family protein [Maribacter aestuarii]|uniref:EpsG family protein n=1 Tax=Maribacter aestuarii TaxID=1130723 RepID=UPI0025A4E60F|nr:EpsG family protein [Maribacter aestuarii]